MSGGTYYCISELAQGSLIDVFLSVLMQVHCSIAFILSIVGHRQG